MNRTRSILALIFFTILSGRLVSGPAVTVLDSVVKAPDNVRYAAADKTVNDKALDLLKKICSDYKFKEDEVPGAIMVGPNYWKQVRGNKSISDTPSIPAKIYVPSNGKAVELEGGVVRFNERTLNLIMLMQKSILESKTVTIRKASGKELEYYWAIICYDIEEPLYVIELEKTRYLIDFDEKGEIFYIEDVTGL